jgi:hypothetical protein
MQHGDDIEKRIDDTMGSLDNMRRAEANPFIFTRIQARLQQSRSGLERVIILTGKPAFAFLVLVIVLVTNMVVMLKGSADASAPTQEQTQFAVADEYDLNVPSLYDYENPEP